MKCSEAFADETLLRPHVAQHQTDCFMCRDCGKEFVLLSLLEEHYRFVEGEGGEFFIFILQFWYYIIVVQDLQQNHKFQSILIVISTSLARIKIHFFSKAFESLQIKR